jgi:HPt (histidine-containing phosphotransfer) domain-containing protein
LAAGSDLRLVLMSSAVDNRVLDQLHVALGGDTSVLRRVIDSYFAGLPARLDALRVAGTDLGLLGRAAHGLASPSATLGVRAIAEPCLALERALDEGKPTTEFITTHLAAVEAAIEPASAALRGWLESHSTPAV